eukprot:CAMPEP_0171457402 /NCGR_PEP_ID=MMETSP0945-20130129/3502_1 /TAXON_ID=109269 /ORGANISM="Vaucheria litorea, Strain CCMP2940" /LENGTH=55 /DNA_ID=CAMNT_0011983017 /DNA_START=249 /DNA_END=416 /DNA_ORIENTATION=+
MACPTAMKARAPLNASRKSTTQMATSDACNARKTKCSITRTSLCAWTLEDPIVKR